MAKDSLPGAEDPVLVHRDCEFIGGPPGTDAEPGPPIGQNSLGLIEQVVELPGTARSLAVSTPVRAGESAELSFVGAPDDLVLALLGSAAVPIFFQDQVWPLLISQNEFILIQLGVADPQGSLSVSILVPQLSVGTGAIPFSFQGIVLPANAPQLQSAPAGELIVIEQGL